MSNGTRHPDLRIDDQGGDVVLFQPLSPAGREWMDANVVSEPWQWVGGILPVPRQSAKWIALGAWETALEVVS